MFVTEVIKPSFGDEGIGEGYLHIRIIPRGNVIQNYGCNLLGFIIS
jgi:hypothetical protein